MGVVNISGLELAIIIILLVLIFNRQVAFWIHSTKATLLSILSNRKYNPKKQEYMEENPKDSKGKSSKKAKQAKQAQQAQQAKQAQQEKQAKQAKQENSEDSEKTDLNDMGYSKGLAWNEVLATTELDPAIQENHNSFVQSTKRFSSGANFTNVSDDNNSNAFVNFVGLLRPSHVPIGASARVVPDVDETVLQRNDRLRW